eukprot:1139340-Pyramimonas_sp.AAC.2
MGGSGLPTILLFPLRTRRTQGAWVYSHDGPIRHRTDCARGPTGKPSGRVKRAVITAPPWFRVLGIVYLAADRRRESIFSLAFRDWCPLRVYSLFPSAIGARSYREV